MGFVEELLKEQEQLLTDELRFAKDEEFIETGNRLTDVKNALIKLGLCVVSQRSELFADQDNRDFILWQRDRDITRLENGKYKWREFEYDRQFFLEKYIEDRNKANCG